MRCVNLKLIHFCVRQEGNGSVLILFQLGLTMDSTMGQLTALWDTLPKEWTDQKSNNSYDGSLSKKKLI